MSDAGKGRAERERIIEEWRVGKGERKGGGR